ncbi:MAG TPA: EAL domain-containing protein [Thermoanaerobaculia bacterium]|nr:EAL domain-containing protein [Thermoanaerobaculia bacterium]
MSARSFQARLLYLLIAVLAIAETGTLVSVHYAGQRAIKRTVDDELSVGTRVFDRVLEMRARTLADQLRVLVSDFAFRDTIAIADLKTITSALENHGKRIGADVVVLIDLDGNVKTDTVRGRWQGKPFPFATMFRQADDRAGDASATVTFAGQPYQFVIVPVLAPRPIAYIAAGFAIDERVLADVARVSSLDVSIWTSPPRGRATNPDFASLVHPLRTGDGSRVNALLQRSLAEARKPFTLLEQQIFALSAIVLIAAVFAAVLFARTVSRPLQVLAAGAGRIGRGEYEQPVVLKQEDELGQLAGAFNSMQSAIAAREEQIMFQATHDSLTGLPNRKLFLDRMAAAIAAAKRTRGTAGMVMMDVDRFKEINDTLGHQFGDQLLIEIGRRLTQTFPNGTIARLGGDEFAVLIDHERDVTERVEAAFEQPVVLGDVSIDVNASLGIATYPEHADDAGTLLRRADVAMYDAKRNQSGVAVYDLGRDEHSVRRLSLMTDLRQAIARDELELYFQPKVDVRTEQVLHAEALVRWNHTAHGVMRPDEFIPLAEQSGRIGLITKWVIRKAIAQCAAWRADGLDLTVAVNLSALDLFDSELPTFISGLLSEAGLPPEKLLLEITESAIMKDAAYAQKVLRDLKRRGMCLAIDDFGTGYSSLAHLKRLPVDELKIDKSFVLNLSEKASDDLVIVRSTIELGHNMGLTVIAEGVESAEAWRVLKDLGCDMAQGYFMSAPLPASKFRDWVLRGRLR